MNNVELNLDELNDDLFQVFEPGAESASGASNWAYACCHSASSHCMVS